MTMTEESSNGLGGRVRHGLTVAQGRIIEVEARAKAQWTEIPAQMRARIDAFIQAAGARVRSALELPSSRELCELLDRVDRLDRLIDELRDARTADALQAARVKMELERVTRLSKASETPANGKSSEPTNDTAASGSDGDNQGETSGAGSVGDTADIAVNASTEKSKDKGKGKTKNKKQIDRMARKEKIKTLAAKSARRSK